MAGQRRIDLVLDSVRRLLRIGATANLLNLLQKQHPADLAQIFTGLQDKEREAAFTVLADRNGPALVVLNKADRTGLGGAGPIAAARRRAADLQAITGVPTVPVVGLLAAVELDAESIAALRVLTTDPADLSSTDAFRSTDHRLAPAVRARLLATLDRFGIAHAVLALSRGADPATLPALLRRVSGVDEMLAQLHTVAAPVRRRRSRRPRTRVAARSATCSRAKRTTSRSSTATTTSTSRPSSSSPHVADAAPPRDPPGRRDGAPRVHRRARR